ncbi:MAG: actin-like protein arp8 [Vezdaea aestivalis]|nr:MAG: actin-like protein arp8 [Vezdaea aestivalis]
MVGKKSGKALLREEGLERTDNNLELTSWPSVTPINQKNYYTEYLKRDDQILALRLQNEERLNGKVRDHKDRDRALALAPKVEPTGSNGDVDMEDEPAGEPAEEDDQGAGSKTIIIHPGSQNLRIGLASEPLPKTIPMVIARRSKQSESEEGGGEPRPKRIRLDGGEDEAPERAFGDEFNSQYSQMSTALKVRMRNNKRRLLPNSKELVVNYNRRHEPDTISEHNDPHRIDWTELPANPEKAPEYFTGHAATRLPDDSKPRYRLYWPLQYGWCNEKDYQSRRQLYQDIFLILKEAIRSQVGIHRRKDYAQYDCVFVIPDLYDRTYVTSCLEVLMQELGFGRLCFIQESLAATFGAGYTSGCVVDIGAQKTSICCVEEGMAIENSRVNLKFGGEDVTEAFTKMMLYDHFPYSDINLKRRYDFILAEELKKKHCTLAEVDISVQLYDFHLRAPRQDTRRYQFKTYDEVFLAPMGLFQPSIFDNSNKLRGRHKLIPRSYDLYDSSPNDPVSSAQQEIYETILPVSPPSNGLSNGDAPTPSRERPQAFSHLTRFREDPDATPRSSVAGSPAPETSGTPQANAENGLNGARGRSPSPIREDPLPVLPLDQAILLSIAHGARGDERKTKDFVSGIMLTGGGSLTPGLHTHLEQRLKELKPSISKDIMIGTPPRELDAQVVVWKGGSVFGKLSQTNDTWIGQLEWDRLGSRVLAYKTIWAW